MLSVYMFWIWVIGGSAAMTLAARSRHRILAFRIYPSLLALAFSVATLTAVQSYLRAALSGNFDSAIGLAFHQLFINPLVRLSMGLGLEQLVYFPLLHVPLLKGAGAAANMISFQLWEVMVADFLFGNIFWLAIGTLWRIVVQRKFLPFPGTASAPERTLD